MRLDAMTQLQQLQEEAYCAGSHAAHDEDGYAEAEAEGGYADDDAYAVDEHPAANEPAHAERCEDQSRRHPDERGGAGSPAAKQWLGYREP